MQTYAAIDLHSNNGVLTIIDETDRVLKQRRIPNKLEEFSGADVAERYENEHLALAMTTTLAVIETLTRQANILEKTVLKKARLRQEWELLLTVWGVGKILGMTIMYEAGHMGRFASPGDFASYCRCVDATRYSNGKKKSDNNAKNGNKYLAWAFVGAVRDGIAEDRHAENAVVERRMHGGAQLRRRTAISRRRITVDVRQAVPRVYRSSQRSTSRVIVSNDGATKSFS